MVTVTQKKLIHVDRESDNVIGPVHSHIGE